jgi:DNA-binding transcriptional ArsR family regulator
MITEEKIFKLTSAVYKVTDLFADKEPLKFAIRRCCLDVLSSYISLIENTSFETKKQAAKKGEIQSKTLIKYFNLAEYQDWIDEKNFLILKNEYSEVNYWFSNQLLRIQKTLGNKIKKPSFYPEDILEDLSEDVIAIENKGIHSSDLTPATKGIPDSFKDRLSERHLSVARAENEIMHNSLKTGLLEDPSAIEIASELVNQPTGEIKNREALYNIGATINYEELNSNQLSVLELLQSKKFLKSTQICEYFKDISERTIRRDIKELKDKGIIIAKGSGKSTSYQLNYIY